MGTVSSYEICSTVMSVKEPVTIIDSIPKSPADKREYLGIILENKLKVMLVSDPSTERSAASLSVAAGSMSDPVELPGLAHFCEHALFLGSEKYPEENGFSKFFDENGGYTNAYTDDDCTNYYFDIAPQSLPEALDRFVQFFISPLFRENGLEREVNAVNSEHDKNIPLDRWRYMEILKVISKPSHPYSKFGTGSRATLWTNPMENSVNVRDALMDFHKTYYASNLMTLCVLGKQSLVELRALVEQLFSPVQSNNLELPSWTENPYGVDELQTWVDILPVMDLREMDIIFPIPDTTEFYKSAPDDYISHLIGYAGQGSLSLLLKNKNWINSLYAGNIVSAARGFSFFGVHVELTLEGLQNVEDIITHIFQYLEILKRNGPQRWIWEELRAITNIEFQFEDCVGPQRCVTRMTPKMINYPLGEVLIAGNCLSDYNPDLITGIISELTPQNCRIVLSTKDNEGKVNLTEPNYGIKYSVRKIDECVIQKWTNCDLHSDLSLPRKNEFIPTNFDMKPRRDHGTIPELIMDEELSRVWFLQDNEFLLPKGTITLEMYSPLALQDPLSYTLNDILERVLWETLIQEFHDAYMAGLSFNVISTEYGLDIVVEGYNHKLGVLLNHVLDKVIHFTCNPQRFNAVKECYERALKNWDIDEPRSHASWYMSYLLDEKGWTNEEIRAIMIDVTMDSLMKYSRDFIKTLKLEWLIYGNFTATEAKELVLNCHAMLNGVQTVAVPNEQNLRQREVRLEAGADHIYKKENPNHSDSCLMILYQSGLQSTRENVLMKLLNQIGREPCFDQLRTHEQLGYVVSSDLRMSNGTLGFRIQVQSNHHPEFLESRVDDFLENFQKLLENLTEEEFLQHRTSLISRKKEKPKNMWERDRDVWREITSRQFQFDRNNVEMRELENVSRQDMVNYYSNLVGPPDERRRRLTIHVLSVSKEGAGNKPILDTTLKPASMNIKRDPKVIQDVKAWKNDHELFPETSPEYIVPAEISN